MEEKTLDKKIAEEFARGIFDQIKNEGDREFRIFHAKAVSATALALAESDVSIDKDVLEMAGWLHDIGYIEGEEKHAEKGIKILEKEGFILSDKMADCVLHHGTWGRPRTKEGKIIQMADDISFINPGILEILMKNGKGKIDKKEMDFLEKMLKGAIGYLRDYNDEIR